MNGLISLISTVAGAALFFHKNKDVDDKGGNTKTDTSTLDPTESSYHKNKDVDDKGGNTKTDKIGRAHV